MRLRHLLRPFAFLLWSLSAMAANANVTRVSFVAADNVIVFADYYASARPNGQLILLFHQAGSNRAEYATIAPMLVALGYNALAVDQRAGGSLWGHDNETIGHLGRSESYVAAYRDLEAALHWAKMSNRSSAVIVWGSSYSAALVFVLAAKHAGEVNALLAFSPGEYLGALSVQDAANHISVPIFVTSAKSRDEEEGAKAILDAAPAKHKVQFVPRVAGTHGSSTLRLDQNPSGAAENWRAVKGFLASLAL